MVGQGAWSRREGQQFDGVEWDERKRQANIAKHDIDFVDAVRALLDAHVVSESFRGAEQRFVAVAMKDGQTIAVIYTVRGAICRIISVRKARRQERHEYRALLGG
jgi:uncharacterized DUF497 family protein